MKLIQKAFLKGTREFEIVDDAVYVRIKGLLKEERLSVDLSTLNPEPMATGSVLEFHGRTNRGPVLSLLLNNPNAGEFNAFIDALTQGALGNNKTFEGLEETVSDSLRAEALARNVYEEPPVFDDPDEAREKNSFQPVIAARLDGDITMLKTYLNEDDIKPLLNAMETLKAEPQNEAAFQKLVDVFNGLGITKGAVLTYAPYLTILMAKTVWS